MRSIAREKRRKPSSKAKRDYLLDAKGNQATLEQEIKDYVQDDVLRKTMDNQSILNLKEKA